MVNSIENNMGNMSNMGGSSGNGTPGGNGAPGTGLDKSSENHSRDQLMKEFNQVIADADALLKSTANISGEKLTELRHKVEQSLNIAKDRLAEIQADVYLKAKAAAKVTDVYVHDNPWRSIGVAAGVGFLIGMMSRRH